LSKETRDLATEAQLLVESLRPLLAGKGEAVQSAALADLTSMWLSGMFAMDGKTGGVDRPATDKLREMHLGLFIDTVLDLIPVNEELTKPMLERKLKRQ